MSKTYSKEDKQRAVAQYVVTGNFSAAAKSTNIPRTTINSWSQSEWWQNLVRKTHTEHDARLDAVMTKNIELAGVQLQDRVIHGDYRLNKKDELIRIPMSGRDLSVAGAVTYDKRNLLRGQPTSIQRTDNNQHLDQLMEHFERLANHKTIDGKVID